MKTHRLSAITGVLAGFCFGHATAANDVDRWQYEVTPYLLIAGLDGTTGVQGFTTDVDASFSDIIDNLDMGFMGLFTARKGPWVFGLEGVYIDIGNESSSPVSGPGGFLSGNGTLEVSSSMYIAQGTVGYLLLDYGKTKLEGFGALRYTRMDVSMDATIQFDEPKPFGGEASQGDSENWVDAVVGLHVLYPVSDSATLSGYFDIGGGGSDLTYQFMAGVNWEFSKGYTAKLGYRHLYWDYEDAGFVWDITAKGPYLGLGFSF
ncbi:hypothetical protein ACQKPX_04940 [Photobacterium sp. DNB23_23_1]|uniref:Outer membrane protein beta-barrel domain-containing protein n=1 Tax=Photobacterium pectinilyticum TaxID=2906793 RepID=A0ABT1N2L3_9GAMM|nr:hypothetical protein [Photobacterium sp. ZSDE20]MCQ1058981.1 hypothetical protein [Photobacterium sp. ZSDE20]MDD1824004.1 hypothetical protein [Photobacterium sp. ZSDE20]